MSYKNQLGNQKVLELPNHRGKDPKGLKSGSISGRAAADKTVPEWMHHGRIPSLDGLRALAVSLVLLAHVTRLENSPFASWLSQLRWLGARGVDLFFVISGFLITLLLMREIRRFGRVSLKQFYLRRFFRIMPAFWFFLFVMWILNFVGIAEISKSQFLSAVTYTLNLNLFQEASWGWGIGHLWSLCVEEHFYLLWPFALFLLTPHIRQAYLLPSFLILGSAWLRWQMRYSETIDSFTLTRLDTIAFGCLMALFFQHQTVCRWVQGLTKKATLVSVASLFLIFLSWEMGKMSWRYKIILQSPLEASLWLLFAAAVIFNPASLPGFVLNRSPVQFIGTLSYSIYLWQQLFLSPDNLFHLHWILRILLVWLCAFLSWRFVETYFLKLKERYQVAS